MNRKVGSGQRKTYSDELREFSRQVSDATFKEEWSVKRGAFILAARFGGQPCKYTLDGIAQHLTLTRERVRQLLDRLLMVAKERRPDFPFTQALIEQIKAYPPAPVAVADNHFRGSLGEFASTADVMRFAHQFLGAAKPTKSKAVVAGTGKRIDITKSSKHASWVVAAWRLAGDQTQRYGAAQLELIAGRVALDWRLAVSRTELIQALSMHPKFRWVDQTTGWFAIDMFGSRSRIELRVKKLLAVATGPLPIDAILESLATEWRWPETNSNLPPMNLHYSTMLACLKSMPGVRVHQYNRLVSTESLILNKVLAKVEVVLLREIEKRGGVARYAQILAAVRKAGLTGDAARMTISSSPIVRLIDRGAYAIRGRVVEPGALARALLPPKARGRRPELISQEN